jgi:hypothetical protein
VPRRSGFPSIRAGRGKRSQFVGTAADGED